MPQDIEFRNWLLAQPEIECDTYFDVQFPLYRGNFEIADLTEISVTIIEYSLVDGSPGEPRTWQQEPDTDA
ncbi:hypothetical protein [Rhodococcus tibetensis]|uniref:Uncharacterized protein n=1 Tax=Rhodococcus tibetensis TaxID=2965064 RepID=A0ABT1QJE6_9NOCA|nr:hypothetical protein [Rhodococcus sp. FXJ9.536]MCQ4122379.1 hypothetical protein [Rhodococcus sp. FXJ9.536]